VANIDSYLKQILTAIYGKDVRQSIHDSISAINNDVLNYNTYVSSALKNAQTSEANALAYKNEASKQAINAANSASTAKNSETKAKTSETNAKNSETKAKTSEMNALASGQAAKSSEENTAKSEKNVMDINTKLSITAESITEKENSISELLDVVMKKLANVVFSVDFETGELVYEDTGTYTFSINTATGNLELEVS
jgi:hypothetical protein